MSKRTLSIKENFNINNYFRVRVLKSTNWVSATLRFHFRECSRESAGLEPAKVLPGDGRAAPAARRGRPSRRYFHFRPVCSLCQGHGRSLPSSLLVILYLPSPLRTPAVWWSQDPPVWLTQHLLWHRCPSLSAVWTGREMFCLPDPFAAKDGPRDGTGADPEMRREGFSSSMKQASRGEAFGHCPSSPVSLQGTRASAWSRHPERLWGELSSGKRGRKMGEPGVWYAEPSPHPRCLLTVDTNMPFHLWVTNGFLLLPALPNCKIWTLLQTLRTLTIWSLNLCDR